jgi:hypothetical protein
LRSWLDIHQKNFIQLALTFFSTVGRASSIPNFNMTNATKFGPRYAIPNFLVAVRGEHGCAILSNRSFVKEQADCYLSSRPGAVVDVEYFETCGHCRGSGRTQGARQYHWVVCKACKGVPSTDSFRIQSFVGNERSPNA